MDLARFPIDRAGFDGPVLVTGAGGCIGSWTLALLTHAGVPAVAFDLSDDQRRPRLLMTEEELAKVPWVTGDIADTEAVTAAVAQHDIRAIIHLAALQVPFCKADPVAGAKVNVVGTVNVFEAARGCGLKRLAYASSIAAHSFFPEAPWLATLYGAYKLCDEMIARTYAGDWDVPSVGIRPGVVYGVGRDQGLTSKTTVAILAAAAERPLHRAVLGRSVGAARRRGRLGVHQGGLNGARRRAGVRSQRPDHHGRRVAGDRARAGAARAAGHRRRAPAVSSRSVG